MRGVDCLVIGRPSDGWVAGVSAVAGQAGRVQTVSPDQAADIDTQSVSVIVGAPPDVAAWVPRCPSLCWIQSTWAGVDSLLAVQRPGLEITPLKGVFGQAMSEYVLGWLLALERSILTRANAVDWQPEPEPGVAGKRLGIMGAGGIGGAVARAASVLNIKVVGLNSDGRPQPGFTGCFAHADRLHFARDLDFLVSVLPSTPATRGIIDGDLLSCLAPGAILINAGRGDAVVTDQMVDALDEGQLRAAVLDVFEEEPLPQDSRLWRHPGVFITSHTAAPTPEAAIPAVFQKNLDRFRNGKALEDAMDPARGY